MEDIVHTITLTNQLTLKKIKKFQTMTASLQNSTKAFIKGPISQDQTHDLSKQEILEKSQILLRQVRVSSLPSRNNFLVTSLKSYAKADLKAS